MYSSPMLFMIEYAISVSSEIGSSRYNLELRRIDSVEQCTVALRSYCLTRCFLLMLLRQTNSHRYKGP